MKFQKAKQGLSKLKALLLFGVVACVLAACANKVLHFEKAEELKKNQEFENQVKIELPADEEEAPTASSATDPDSKAEVVKAKATPTTTSTTLPKKSKAKATKAAAAKLDTKRQPDLESDEGFSGRRPLVDPFRVGEKVVHEVTYLAMAAGTLTMEVRPFANVNQRKAYQLRTAIKTSSLFSSFYAVDDYVNVLMDFEELLPSVFTLHLKETSVIKEAQMLLDHKKNIATYWEKKVTKKDGESQKKLEWETLPYSQNVFSAAFYLRFFKWDLGVERKFRVTDDKRNLVFKAKAIRKEKLKTDAGEFDTIVIKPEMELKGKFEPTGENLIWLTDDDRKFIVRIESKIKIGTLVSEVVELKRGQP